MTIRRVLGALTAAVAATLLATVPASAMVNGTADTAHPEAGALYFSSAPGAERSFACSGVLIDTQVFLTAAHCFADYVRATGALPTVSVTFAQRPTAASTYYGGTVVIDPQFDKLTTTNNLYADDVHDFAVVRLDADPGIAPAQLPALNAAATLDRGTEITTLGYGTSVTQGGGAPTYPPTGDREAAALALQTVTGAWLHESQNPTLGHGGACGGDSGGPNYLGDTHVVLGTTVTGDMVCRSTNVSIRLDTPTARAFLGPQVSYPLP